MTSAIEYDGNGIWMSNGSRDVVIEFISKRLRQNGRTEEADQVAEYLDHMFPGCCIDLADLNGIHLTKDDLLLLLEQDPTALPTDLPKENLSYFLQLIQLLGKVVKGEVPRTPEGYFPNAMALMDNPFKETIEKARKAERNTLIGVAAVLFVVWQHSLLS